MNNAVVLSGWDVNLPTIKNFEMLSRSLILKKKVTNKNFFGDDDLVSYFKMNDDPKVIKFHNNGIDLHQNIYKVIDNGLKNANLTHEILSQCRVRIYLAGQGARADLIDYQGFYDKNDAEDLEYSSSIKNLHSNQYAQDSLAKKLLEKYKLDWPPVSIYCASNSALMATHIAHREISYGAIDIGIVLSWTDVLLQDVLFMDSQNMLAKEFSQPFSQYSEGVILSDGYSVLILENSEHSRKRKEIKRIYINYTFFMQSHAERTIGGVAFNFYTISKVISKALDLAKYSPFDIGAIFIHGNGSIINDKAEIMAIYHVFKGCHNIPLLSYKGQIGYISNCSGIIDLMIMTDSFKRNRLIPSVSHYPLDEKLDLNFLSNKEIVPYCNKPMLKLGLGMDGSIIVMILTTDQE